MDFNADSYDISTLWRCGGLTVRPVCGPVVPQTANLVLDKTTLALAPGETSVLICTASGAAGASVGPMWSSSNSAVATVDDKGNVTAVFTGTSTISAVTVDGAAKAVCEVTVGPVTPEYIDLGLSVKWATFNLGATAPEEPGVFFAWGETVAKNTFDWTNYKWCKGRENTLTKYNADSAQGTVDNKTVLEPEDDAATAAYGPGWRIPTAEEWQELFDNGTLVYYDDNVGFRLRSNKEGFTDKTIFIPYGGSMSGFTLYGSSGRYWTASRDGNSVVGLYPVSRIFNEKPYFGQAIRPVHE
ncbi:MAG: Ig-like domain-containing protein [Bacteroidales bacterium]|nr:Ig-like domain-containing protein [Bacteroidales bacterium]